MDMVAPFLHEFTYQAMAYDLLDLKDDKYASVDDSLDEMRLVLTGSSHSTLYVPVHQRKGTKWRNRSSDQRQRLGRDGVPAYMSEVIEKLTNDFKEFTKKNESLEGFVSIDMPCNAANLIELLMGREHGKASGSVCEPDGV